MENNCWGYLFGNRQLILAVIGSYFFTEPLMPKHHCESVGWKISSSSSGHWKDSFEAAGCIFLVFFFFFHLEDLRVEKIRFEWPLFEKRLSFT